MSNKADKCPKCGAPAKKKTSTLTWIIAGFFGLVIIISISSNNSATPTNSSASLSSDSPTVSTVIKPEWDYDNSKDTVSGKDIKRAVVHSNNSFEMDFPYQGGTTGSLIIRKHPRYGKDVIFSINKGQLLCDIGGCQVSVRFDDKKPYKVHVNEPEDHSNTVLFLSGYDKLVKEIKNSKKMIVEATFYQNGAKAFEFDVSNFKFE